MAIKPPPAFATAIIVIRGKPTAVARKPNIAGIYDCPARLPANGGKMILPAPKKKANVIKPMAKTSAVFNLVVINILSA